MICMPKEENVCKNCGGTGKDPSTDEECGYCNGQGIDNEGKFEKETEQAAKDRANLESIGKEVRQRNEAYNKGVMDWINASLNGDHNETLRLFKEKERLLREANEASARFLKAYENCYPDYKRFLL